MFNQHAANTEGLLTKTRSSSSSSYHLLQPLCIFILSAFFNAARNEYWQQWKGVFHPTTRSAGCILSASPWGVSFPHWMLASRAQCMPTPLHLLLPLMHLYAALKGCGLMMGDHSTYLRCSCKYSNEPSSVDGVKDNGSIFYLPLLLCDSRIYLVDGIIVPPKAPDLPA